MTSLGGACFTSIIKQMSRLNVHQGPIVRSVVFQQFPRHVEDTSLKCNEKRLDYVSHRNFSSSRGKKANKSSNKAATRSKDEVSLQHVEWVNFQKSIAVDGFETGQITQIQSGKKVRGRKSNNVNRLSVAELKLAERQRLTDVGGGHYPPMRYSDEDTERLLNEAYAALPERAGKRGTRNIKRQKLRWASVRQIRKKYKSHLVAHHFKKMAKRSEKVEKVRAVLSEAPKTKQNDKNYQAEVLRHWMSVMLPKTNPLNAVLNQDELIDLK